MEGNNVEEGFEPSVHKIESTIKNVSEVSEEGTVVSAVDDRKLSLQEAVENLVTDRKEEAPAIEPVNQVNEPADDEIKNSNPADQAQVPTENGASNQSKTTSKRVQEGQRWNDRNREKEDYSKNIKSDLTSQEESNDPVAIRKQVG